MATKAMQHARENWYKYYSIIRGYQGDWQKRLRMSYAKQRKNLPEWLDNWCAAAKEGDIYRYKGTQLRFRLLRILWNKQGEWMTWCEKNNIDTSVWNFKTTRRKAA